MWLLLELLLAYIVLLLFFPKGNPIQEALYMPLYWLQTFTVNTNYLQVTKHSFGEHKMQYLLYFAPRTDAPSQRNVIIYYHGGGWRFGKAEMFKANAKVFTDKGYHVFMPSYRRTPKFDYTHIREDLNAALDKINYLMQNEKFANKKIILGGMSAGGNLAALILYDRASLAKIYMQQSDFSGIFLCGAPLDISKMRDSFPLRDFAGERDGDNFKAANPVQHLQADEQTPVLCIHGHKDGWVEYASATSFLAKMESINLSLVTTHLMPKGTHLDAGRWVYQEDEVRERILVWAEGV